MFAFQIFTSESTHRPLGESADIDVAANSETRDESSLDAITGDPLSDSGIDIPDDASEAPTVEKIKLITNMPRMCIMKAH
jgi:hypothetical protein